MRCIARWLLAAFIMTVSSAAFAAEPALEALKSGGHVFFLRHAQTTPGVGDPSNFALDDCSTQRNLNEVGKQQARDLGETLRAAEVPVAQVLTSPWCRSRDTAVIMDVGPVEDSELVASIWNDEVVKPDRSEELREVIRTWEGPGNLILVSHGINIRRLIGRSAGQGGGWVLKPAPETDEGYVIVGRLP